MHHLSGGAALSKSLVFDGVVAPLVQLGGVLHWTVLC